jgi:serine/threonine-protein kinase
VSETSTVERYELLGELATGGMATVYFGRQRGAFGFSRAVAIKSMHPQLAKDPAFRAMFIDEANLTARIRHPNVVPTLDIVSSPTKLLIVMEYVEGVSLSVLLRAARARGKRLPVPVVVAILRDLLDGLHAAHELTDDRGQPLNVVHRDVSPQNLLVGVDGLARVVDFGVAKAAGRSYHTQTGEIRGKVGYMAPEQMFGEEIDRRVDVYAAGVVAWEALVGERLFHAPTDAALVLLVMKGTITPPSDARREPLPPGLDDLIAQALAHDPANRPATTTEMMQRLVAIAQPAPREVVGALVRELAPKELELRASYTQQSTPGLGSGDLEPEARAILDALTRATMSRDTTVTAQAVGARRYVPMALTLVAVAGLSLATGASLVRKTRTSVASAEPATGSAVPSASPSAAVTAADPAVPAPVAVDSASLSPADSAALASKRPQPHSGAASSKKPKGANGAATSSAPKPEGAAKPDCALPYVTDDEGHRHYKAECLK